MPRTKDGAEAGGGTGSRAPALVGRRLEVGELRAEVTGPGPTLTLVSGRSGVGKTALLSAAFAGLPHVGYGAPPATDPDHRSLLVGRLREAPWGAGEGVPDLAPDADWPVVLRWVAAGVGIGSPPRRLVLDGFDRLVQARSRLPGLVAAAWAEVRSRGLPVHLVLAGGDAAVMDALRDDGSPLAGWITLDLPLGPLPYRDVGAFLPRLTARDLLVAAAVFGGTPAVLRHLRGHGSPAAAIRATLLEPSAPLLDVGADLLDRAFQSPARYGSVLRALSLGRREWGEVVDAVPDFGSAGQLAPYVARMESLGLVRIERALDAAPRSRARRYALADPFLAFWYRFVFPSLAEISGGRGAEVWSRRIRPELDGYVALHFPSLCREWVRRYGADRLGAPGREIGALWGPDHDVEVAGTLRTGAAVYGRCVWAPGRPVGEEVLDDLELHMRRTRFGFGRERRFRVVFTDGAPDDRLLRRAIRDENVRIVGPEELAGSRDGSATPGSPAG